MSYSSSRRVSLAIAGSFCLTACQMGTPTPLTPPKPGSLTATQAQSLHAPIVSVHTAPVAGHAGGLFRENFDESRVTTPAELDGDSVKAFKEEFSRAQFGNGYVNPQPTPWGLIGAGTLGTGLLAYGLYAGFIGSRDLMTPKNIETFTRTPAAEGWPFDRLNFQGHDGVKLVGWYVPAAAPTNRALLMLHGHTSNKDKMLERYGRWLHQYNLFFYDSRYHGESDGKLTTLGWHERRDAAIALDLVKARGNSSIGVMGVSMGGAVAIGLAADRPEIKSVWSDCSFDSLHGAVAPRAKLRQYAAPDYVAWSVVKMASARAGHDLSKADPIRCVNQIAPRPLYLVHGLNDNETTAINSQRLFEKAIAPKSLWEVPNAAHAESSLVDPAGYEQRLTGFFAGSL